MRFTLATAVTMTLAAATFSSAAIVPRANEKGELTARYFRGEIYGRDIPAARPENLVNRRLHARDFRSMKSVV